VGVVLATQNPMDLDYRALSNAGLWCLGRLQTDADRARVVEGITESGSELRKNLNATLQRLGTRWFVVRDVYTSMGLALLQPRWAMSWMRGPMTRSELRTALGRTNVKDSTTRTPTHTALRDATAIDVARF
jgi:hypothetical protein